MTRKTQSCDNDKRASEHDVDAGKTVPRKKKKKKLKRQTIPNVQLAAILLGGMFALAMGGVGLYFAFRKAPAANSSSIAAKDQGQVEREKRPRTNLPAGWDEISSTKGGFVGIMPKPYIEGARTMPSPVGPVKDFQYLRETDGTRSAYAISFAEFTPTQVEKMSLDRIVDEARDALVSHAAKVLELIEEDERCWINAKEEAERWVAAFPEWQKLWDKPKTTESEDPTGQDDLSQG